MTSHLRDLTNLASIRDKHEIAILGDMQAGEVMIQALYMRLRRLNDAIMEATALRGYYQCIIEECMLKNPVKDTKRLQSLGRQVALAKSQAQSLINQKNLLSLEKEWIEKEEMVKVRIYESCLYI